MGFPIVGLIMAVPSIVKGVVALVNTVERLFNKPKAGAEKKGLVLNGIEDMLREDLAKAEKLAENEDYVYFEGTLLFFDGKYDWKCLIGKLPRLRVAVGNLIDAVVDLKNILAECDE